MRDKSTGAVTRLQREDVKEINESGQIKKNSS